MTTMTTTVEVLPLLFSFQVPIVGNGFHATINLRGRLLARVEPESVWLEGVNPGALAVSGSSLEDANAELRQTLINVFIDFAEETEDADAFKAQIDQFFTDTDDETISEWESSVKRVRAGEAKALGDLPRASADTERGVTVDCKPLQDLTPADNVTISKTYQQGLAAAA